MLLRTRLRRVPVRLPRHCLVALLLHPLLGAAIVLRGVLGAHVPDVVGCFAVGGLWVVPLSWFGVWWIGARAVADDERWKLETLAFLLWASVGVLGLTAVGAWIGVFR